MADEEALFADDTVPVVGELPIVLTVEEADMIAKVLLQARRGNLGTVAYRPILLSRTRKKVMRTFGLTSCNPDPK